MKRRKIYKDIKVDGKTDISHIRVEIYYDKGGMSYLSGKEEKRGLYLSLVPVKKDGSWTTVRIYNGVRMFVKPMKRFSNKQLKEFEPDPEQVDQLLDLVLTNSDLTREDLDDQGTE